MYKIETVFKAQPFLVTTTQAPNSAVTTDGDDGQIYEEDFHEGD
jgi:hypothetical protein